jgi:thymidylate kinase
VIVDWIDFLALKLRRHDGRVLVCDRWFLWDVLSQAVQYGVDLTPILDLSVKFPAPDVSFFLRATPENAHGRLLLRETPKIHCNETLECLKRLTTAFEEVRRLTAWRPCVVETDGRGFDAVLDSVMGIVLGAIEDDRRGEMKNAPAIRARSRMRRPT